MPAAMLIPAPTTTHMFLSVDMINMIVNICDLEEHLILQCWGAYEGTYTSPV